MAKHYPLNGIDLDHNRYEHRPLGARDIMASRIMEDCMNPQRIIPRAYRQPYHERAFTQIKQRDERLGLDLQVLSKMLTTDRVQRVALTDYDRDILYTFFSSTILDDNWFMNPTDELDEVVLGLVERHHLEMDPSVRIWLKSFNDEYRSGPRRQAPGWKKDMVEHLKQLQPASKTHYDYNLHSGGHFLPYHTFRVHFHIDPCIICPTPLTRLRAPNPRRLSDTISIRRGKTSRSSSMPSFGAYSWSTAIITSDIDPNFDKDKDWFIYHPTRPWSELDKLTRRRSLSRTHIRAMFTDKPKLAHDKLTNKKHRATNLKHPCANCAQYTHLTKHCTWNCGYCASMYHKASVCPVKVENRCKCRPFPQYHLASQCYVRCSRRCGCPHPLGHFRHKTAMVCNYRCCMCGAKGHSGRKCSMKKCPCGEQHLTQDCRWKVECPVKDCYFYLCHLHCRECGKKKEKGSKDKFVGRTCQDCLKNGKPLAPKAE
ncbi:hypothetical protein M426DRAFT_324342 [Hypoxylon sp. CI-4A]|nr:hypothetical protein M426DRAFT_324342 [Hypoxylon sp. CI-4A]